MLRLHVIAVMAVVVSSAACGPSPSPPAVAPPPAPAVAAPPPVPAVAATPPAPAVAAPPPICAVDEDCNFAEGVQPARCIVGPVPAARKQRAKIDGSCVCLAGGCALRPDGVRISQQACDRAVDNCELDVPTARCEPDITSSDAPRGRSYGPSCACDRGDQRCHLRWFDPIPCRTTDDCWASDEPVAHALPRPRRLRGRAFRGCVDGEHVPTCVDGRCALEALGC